MNEIRDNILLGLVVYVIYGSGNIYNHNNKK